MHVTTRTADKEELKNLLLLVNEENEKASLKLNINTHTHAKSTASSPISSWQVDGEKQTS